MMSSAGNFCIIISTYFAILIERQQMYGEAYFMSSLRGTEHAFSFNFILCRELVMTVNIAVQERSRIVASAGSLMH